MKQRALILVLLILVQVTAAFSLDDDGTVRLLRELTTEVIGQDTVWSGTQTINGIVVVKKGATLLIKPGTIIKFNKLDVDGDGIGDSELIVEGSLIANGAKAEPIVFMSAAANPQRRDWKFIMVNFSAGVKLNYCVIEHAFSAIQVHFSKAEITNSILRNNEDGLRFSTARLTFEHNEIYDNVYGIRYEERGSKAYVNHNVIRDNDYGVFSVMKSTDISRFEDNNIYNNRKYNLLLGNRQHADISMPNNYWGSDVLRIVMDKIFAKNFDETLGAVNITPLQPTPVTNAGLQ